MVVEVEGVKCDGEVSDEFDVLSQNETGCWTGAIIVEIKIELDLVKSVKFVIPIGITCRSQLMIS